MIKISALKGVFDHVSWGLVLVWEIYNQERESEELWKYSKVVCIFELEPKVFLQMSKVNAAQLSSWHFIGKVLTYAFKLHISKTKLECTNTKHPLVLN
jgi:hypothetical protein